MKIRVIPRLSQERCPRPRRSVNWNPQFAARTRESTAATHPPSQILGSDESTRACGIAAVLEVCELQGHRCRSLLVSGVFACVWADIAVVLAQDGYEDGEGNCQRNY